jgi:DNA-directed RNA polymerase subunit beta
MTYAMKRTTSVGDKFAGRHGNKGCIARILPRSEMPYLGDGTPVQMVLNPLGVVSRIDLGQILETHFGALAHALGTQFVIPPFTGPSTKALSKALGKAGLGETGMATLYDGATGRPFDSPVTVGYLYMMKLSHRAEDKIHAFSTAALCAGQTAVRGTWGQRAGFLELWALEAYNAGATLQEFLTVKAEDAPGREKTALALLAGEEIDPPSEGGSLELLENALRGVGIKVEEKR